jgi:hypothetical protein
LLRKETDYKLSQILPTYEYAKGKSISGIGKTSLSASFNWYRPLVFQKSGFIHGFGWL